MFALGITYFNASVEIVINVKFGGFRYALAYWQTKINSRNLDNQFRF